MHVVGGPAIQADGLGARDVRADGAVDAVAAVAQEDRQVDGREARVAPPAIRTRIVPRPLEQHPQLLLHSPLCLFLHLSRSPSLARWLRILPPAPNSTVIQLLAAIASPLLVSPSASSPGLACFANFSSIATSPKTLHHPWCECVLRGKILIVNHCPPFPLWEIARVMVRLYIDVGQIVGRSPSPLVNQRTQFSDFSIFSPYILFKVFFNTKSESTTLI
jgi:hypothetical protein